MRFAAFLRNTNLGQPGSPTRAQLEAAFLVAGATEAFSFLTNGTLLYSIPDGRRAQSTADLACEILNELCGLKEPAFTVSYARLVALVKQNPYARLHAPSSEQSRISFFARTAARHVKPPIQSARGDCVIFHIEPGIALSITRTIDGEVGYPTPVLEKVLGVPVTTRNWRTVQRLVAKFG